MTDPPSDAPGETLPHASAPARHLSTNTYPRCGHGRGRRTSKAVSARRLCRSGTNATGPWTQIDDVGHGYVARGCPMDRAGRPDGIRRGMFVGSRRRPTEYPGWRQTRRRKRIAEPTVDSVARGNQPALDGSTGGEGSNESCRISRSGLSANPFRDPHPEALD